jgi:uncharacterized membrane protein HdeD (DUF308 family)
MTQTVRQLDKKSRSWMWLVASGLVMVVLGTVIGFQKAGALCGSPLNPQSPVAEMLDTFAGSHGAVADCRKIIAEHAVPTWGLIILGVAVILLGILVRAVIMSRPSTLTVFQVPQNVAMQQSLYVEDPLDFARRATTQATAMPLVSTLPSTGRWEFQPGRPLKTLAPPSGLRIATGTVGIVASLWGILAFVLNVGDPFGPSGPYAAWANFFLLGSGIGTMVTGIITLVNRRQRKPATPPALLLFTMSLLLAAFAVPATPDGSFILALMVPMALAVLAIAGFGVAREKRQLRRPL